MSELNVMAQWLQANQDWLALMIGVIAFLESVVVIGLLLPGVVMLFTAASLAGGGALDMWTMLFAGFLGALLGDGASFILGQVFQQRIRGWWPFSSHPQWLKQGERFFEQHGGISIALGRFIGPIRPVIPVVAGMMGMPARYFYLVNFLSALLWAPAYLLPGYFVGASLHWQQHMALEVLVLLVVVSCGAIFLAYASHWLVRRTLSFRSLINRAVITFLVLFSALAIYAFTSSGIETNQQGLQWMQAVRTPLMDDVFTAYTYIGDVIVMAVMVLLGAFWVWQDGRTQGTLWPLFVFLFLAGVLKPVNNLIQYLFTIERPEIATEVSYAFPDGHTAYTLFIGLWLGWYFGCYMPERYKPWPWCVGLVTGLLMGISRLYLGEHWLVDVLGGYVLGTLFFMLWLASIARKPLVVCSGALPWRLWELGLLSVALFFGVYYLG